MAKSYYAAAWREYHEEGYAPLPLPPREKFPPPHGWTGGGKANSGKVPPEAQCERWAKEGYGAGIAAGNIAIRLPKSVIGIDVDMYDGKRGRETLASAEAEWGILPPTWVSTSRSDGSGIRLFRIPEGLAWASLVGDAGSGIEIVRWDHRYAVVAPSVHPEGPVYGWVKPDGSFVTDEFPSPGELPELPERWVDGLTGGRAPWVSREEAELTHEEVTGWVANRPSSDGELCSEMSGTLDRGRADMAAAATGGGLHEAALKSVWGLLRDAAHGHSGVMTALTAARAAFMAAAKVRGHGRTSGAGGEWFRAVSMGVCKVAAEVGITEEDPCASAGAVSWSPEFRQSLRGFIEDRPDLTDEGNARRFNALYGEDVRWYGAEGMWLVWSGDRWERDRTGEAERKAKGVIKFVSDVEAAAVDGEDIDWFTSLKKHAKALGKRATRAAMLDDFKSIPGISVVPEQLDADKRLLQCNGKLVRLAPSGLETKLPLRDYYQTLSTGTVLDPSARLGAWDDFVKRAMPDEELRRWVQKAIGYSLMGGNPERLLFFIKGDTSTGKSVFAEAIAAALGDYSGTFDMTLFRSQKEQGPNVQLVRLLDKRIVFTSETSAERVLHGDQLKRVTGNDRMSARLIRSNEMVEKTPAFTAWIMTNQTPTIHGADKALYRRLLCVPFDEQIPQEEQNVGLRDELNETERGRSAVLAWALAGWEAYSREGLRDVPSAVSLATMELRGELSNLDMWIAEECEQGGQEFTGKTADLHAAYRIWCAESAIRESDVEDRNLFGRRLVGKGFMKARLRDGSDRVWGFRGIRLRV